MGRFKAAKKNMKVWKEELAKQARDKERMDQLEEYCEWADNL